MKKGRTMVFLGIGIALITALFLRTDFRELRDAFRQFHPDVFIVLFSMQVVTMLLITLQWRFIALHMGAAVGLKKLFVMLMGGTLLESLTPAAKTGGEGYKVYFLHTQENMPTASAFSLVAVQKLLSVGAFTALLVVAVVVTIWQGIALAGVIAQALLVFTGFVVLVLVGILIVVVMHRRVGFLARVMVALKDFKRRRGLWGFHVLIGAMVWLLYVVKAHVLFAAFDVTTPFIVALAATMIAYTVAMLPLTPGGLGTFEGTFVGIAVLFFVDGGVAFAVVLTLRLFTFWMSFLVSLLTVGFVTVKGWKFHAHTS